MIYAMILKKIKKDGWTFKLKFSFHKSYPSIFFCQLIHYSYLLALLMLTFWSKSKKTKSKNSTHFC